MSTNTTLEQLTSNSRSQSDTFFTCSRKFLEGLEKMCELNLQALKTNLGEHQEHARQSLNAKDPGEYSARYFANILQPMPEKWAAYGSQICGILARTQSECAKTAEHLMNEHNQQLQALTENLSQYSPPGVDGLSATHKIVQNLTSSACETACKMGRQIFDSFNEASSQVANQLVEKMSNTGQSRSRKQTAQA